MEIIRAGRLILLAGLEIESKWKKGRDKREIILVQVENRSEIIFFFLIKIESCIFQEKEFEKYTV